VTARAWTAANVVMLLLFVFSVVVQVNDPDPALWMFVYALAAAACALELARRTRWWLPAVTAALALAWSLTLAPGVVGRVPFLEMFSAWEMRDQGIEESREMYGLLIVAAWMVVLAVRARRSPKRT
jgi:hypothetical protein